MAQLAVHINEGHFVMTGAAILSVKDILHGIDRRTFFNAEDIRVTQLAAVPDGMFFMGKDNIRHAGFLGMQGGIIRALDRLSFDGDTGDFILQRNQTLLLGLHPVNPVAKTRSREAFGYLGELFFKGNLLAERMAAVAVFCTSLAVNLSGKGILAVMAGAAVQTASYICLRDSGTTSGHGKTKINMAEPAGILRAVQPVFEDNRCRPGLRGKVIDSHVAVLFGPLDRLFHTKTLGTYQRGSDAQ